MLSCLGVDDEARQTEIDHVHCVTGLTQPHHGVVRLDVPVNVMLGMHELDTVKDLVEQHQSCLEAEPAATELL